MTEDDAIVVEFDVFSGRPNPRWTLAGPARRRVLDAIAALPPAGDAAPRPLGLGARGFVLTFPDGHAPVRIVDGRIEGEGGGRDDRGGRVARLLRDSAPADVLAAFGSMMGD